MSTPAADVEKLLSAGTNLPLQEYINLLNKVKSGGVLTPRESERYNELDAELRAKYIPADEIAHDKPSITTLENLLAVAQYLKEKGYRIGKSSVYNHKKEGKIRPDPVTGHYSTAVVDKYASLHLEHLDGTTKESKKSDSLQYEKLSHEVRIRKAQAEQQEIEAKKAKEEVIPVVSVNIRDAAKAATLRSDDLNWIYSRSAAIIQTVNGDPALEADLIEFLKSDRESIFARYDDKTPITVDLPAALLDGIDNQEQIDGLDTSRA